MMRWAQHVARIGERGMHAGVWWGNLKERDYLEDLDVEGILKWILEKQVVGYGLESSGSG
jgi:hypothetical protein